MKPMPTWLKQQQIESMWEDYESGRLALDTFLRKRYRSMTAQELYEHLRRDRREGDLYRFFRNDPVADYEEVADVIALID